MRMSLKYLVVGTAVATSSVGGVAIANAVESNSPPQVTVHENEHNLSPEEKLQADANGALLDEMYASDAEILIEDEHGEVGWVSFRLQQDLYEQRLRTIVELRAANPDADFDDQAISSAYLVLDRIPVRIEEGGAVIGYLGPDGAISPEDYPTQRELAEQVVLDAGGTVE